MPKIVRPEVSNSRQERKNRIQQLFTYSTTLLSLKYEGNLNSVVSEISISFHVQLFPIALQSNSM